MSTTLLASGTAVLSKTKNQSRMAENDERMRLRILESKYRAIGIDKDALDAQLEEHAMTKAAESEEDRRYAEALREAVARAEEAAGEEELIRAEEHAKLRGYWRYQADRTDRPEWDIIDPEANRKALPPRTETDISRCGPSSIQVFDSEFLDEEEAKRKAKAIAEENAELIRQRKEALAREREADRLEAEAQRELLSTLSARDFSETMGGVSDAVTFKDENKRLAAERKALLRAAKEEELAKEREHLLTMTSHPLLTEHRSQGYGMHGPGSRRRDHYKGMSKEELAAIREEQARQRAEKEEARRREREEELRGSDIWNAAAEAAETVHTSELTDSLDAQRQYVLDLKAQQREARLRRKQQKAEEDAVVDWRGGILDGFNKRGR